MPNIKYTKARKEYACGKCGVLIHKGDMYYRGTQNFQKYPTIRCNKCKLKTYEMSSSMYIQNVGRLQDRWLEDYSDNPNMLEEIIDILTELKDNCEDSLENMPDNLKETSVSGQTLIDRIDFLSLCIEDLEAIEEPESEDLHSEEWLKVKEIIENSLGNLEY